MTSVNLVQVEGEDQPRGLCWCGCGKPTRISKKSDFGGALYRGVAARYLPNHCQRQRLPLKTGECWLWTSTMNTYGYGRFTFEGVQHFAHRVAYEWLAGPIPEGMQLDHICHVKACVNPSHLRPVTNKQNQENLVGARAHSRSGVRGVHWDKRRSRWIGQVAHYGRRYIKSFITFDEACAYVIELRNELFTHNDADRVAS